MGQSELISRGYGQTDREMVEFLDTELNTVRRGFRTTRARYNGLAACKIEGRFVGSGLARSMPVCRSLRRRLRPARTFWSSTMGSILAGGAAADGCGRIRSLSHRDRMPAWRSTAPIFRSMFIREASGITFDYLRRLGLGEGGHPFLDWKGILLGRRGHIYQGNLARVACKALALAVGGPVLLREGHEDCAWLELVGIITGGAGSEVEAIAGEGIDTPLRHRRGPSLEPSAGGGAWASTFSICWALRDRDLWGASALGTAAWNVLFCSRSASLCSTILAGLYKIGFLLINLVNLRILVTYCLVQLLHFEGGRCPIEG